MQRHYLIGFILLLLVSTNALADDQQMRQMQMMRNRLLALYTGNPVNPGHPWDAAGLTALEQSARRILDQQSSRPDQPQRRSRRGPSARNILTLAQAWSTPGCDLYNVPQVKQKIESELADLEQIIRPGSPHPGNWYTWVIALPRVLGPALILCEGRIDQDLFDASVAGMDACLPQMSLSGANASMEARNNVYLAMLKHDPEYLTRAVNYLKDQVSVSGGATGLLEDYTFQFHGRLLHTMGYGPDAIFSIAQVAYLCEGTQWAVSPEGKNLLTRHLLEHVPWPIIGDTYDLSVRGRQVTTNFRTDEHIEAMMLLAAVNPDRARDLRLAAAELARRAAGNENLDPLWTDYFSPDCIKPVIGFRHFYASDYAIFRRPDFYTSVRMYSSRVIDYEGNPAMAGGTNLSGWFLCYGMTCISRLGDPDAPWMADSQVIRSDNFDWEHLPGTTTRLGVHPPRAYNLSRNHFAGGAGGDRPQSAGVCGFVLMPAAGDYTARKSYHFFPMGFVALGSGITSTSEHTESVITTINQWPAPAPDLPLVLSGNRQIDQWQGNDSWNDVRWAWHDDVGYVFPHPVTLHGQRRDILTTLWLDHGPNPQNASYAYIVLPNATRQQTAAFAENPSIRILQQDETAHACEQSPDGTTGLVFWQPGEAADITTDAPAVCYIEPRRQGKVVTVQNPLHTESQLHLRLAGQWPAVQAAAPEATAITTDDETRLTVNTIYGRLYRVGLGVSDVQHQPREDYAPYASFSCDTEILDDGRTIILTLHLPEKLIGQNYRVQIRGQQGHLRAEFTEKDALPPQSSASQKPNIIRYRWQRSPDSNTAGETSSSIFLITNFVQIRSDPFAIPKLTTEAR